MKQLTIDSLILRATLELGSEYTYTIREGGLGPTLYVDAETKEQARKAREKIPSQWEGLRVIVIYCSADEEDELYDPNLS